MIAIPRKLSKLAMQLDTLKHHRKYHYSIKRALSGQKEEVAKNTEKVVSNVLT